MRFRESEMRHRGEPSRRYTLRMRTAWSRSLVLCATLPLLVAASPSLPHPPSRPAERSCAWEPFEDQALGLAAWVQRCDYGTRKIDFLKVKNTLAMRYSDSGGAPETVIEVFDLRPGESPRAGVLRVLLSLTDKKVAARCVVAPFTDPTNETPTPAGVERFSFVPDAKYRKELDAKQDPDEIPDPPCGDRGETADSVQYWETQPQSGARHILFVSAGQDTPLFDDTQLKLLPPR